MKEFEEEKLNEEDVELMELSEEEEQDATGGASVRSYKIVQKVILNGEYTYRFSDGSLPLRIIMDGLSKDKKIIVEWKTNSRKVIIRPKNPDMPTPVIRDVVYIDADGKQKKVRFALNFGKSV